MPDLHSRIASELSRRLEVAKAATPGPWRAATDYPQMVASPTIAERRVTEGLPPDEVWLISTTLSHRPAEDATYLALHDPADAQRRYSSALRVLERHTPSPDRSGRLCCGCWNGDAFEWIDYPCNDLLDLAASLGLDTEGSTTDG